MSRTHVCISDDPRFDAHYLRSNANLRNLHIRVPHTASVPTLGDLPLRSLTIVMNNNNTHLRSLLSGHECMRTLRHLTVICRDPTTMDVVIQVAYRCINLERIYLVNVDMRSDAGITITNSKAWILFSHAPELRELSVVDCKCDMVDYAALLMIHNRLHMYRNGRVVTSDEVDLYKYATKWQEHLNRILSSTNVDPTPSD